MEFKYKEYFDKLKKLNNKSLVEKIIPSKDIRYLIESTNYKFSNEDYAGLIANSKEMSIFEKIDEIVNIPTDDEKLLNEIDIYVTYYMNKYNEFISNNDNKYCYRLMIWNQEEIESDEDSWYSENGLFIDFETLLKVIIKISDIQKNALIRVEKLKINLSDDNIFDDEDDGYINTILGHMYFGYNFTLWDLDLNYNSIKNISNPFWEKYVFIPTPFLSGDIVQSIQRKFNPNFKKIIGKLENVEYFMNGDYTDMAFKILDIHNNEMYRVPIQYIEYFNDKEILYDE